MALERAAIDVSNEVGRTIKWTDIANVLFDEYLNEAKKDIASSMKKGVKYHGKPR